MNKLLIFILLFVIFLLLSIINNKTKFSDNIPITKKSKIVIVLTGQLRTNNCCFGDDKDNIVSDSFKTYFINDELKNNYDYDIFISTDKIDIEKTLNYFGKDHLKNIFTSDDNKYLIPIKSEIQSLQYYLDRYNKKDFKNNTKYTNVVPQLYRHYNALNMINNYNNLVILLIENNKLRFRLNDYSDFEDGKERWVYSDELQRWEYLYNYVINKKLNLNNTINILDIIDKNVYR